MAVHSLNVIQVIKRAILTFAAALSLTSPALPPATVAYQTPVKPTPITYIAHRGGSLEVPENSMEGLRAAYQRGTAQILDFDTRLLADGTPVVMHDATLDRTTDDTGPVRNLTLAEWKLVRIMPRPELGPGWHPERPPTVAEVLDAFGGRIRLTLEAKDPESLPALARMIKERKLTASVYVNTNLPSLAQQIKKDGLLTQLWRSAAQMRTDRPEQWRGFVDAFDVDYLASDADLRKFVQSGVPQVWAHTITTVRDRDRALRLGCNGIMTDAPGLMRRGETGVGSVFRQHVGNLST
ncbi:MAG: glycerophosphoryl diester phosphodiesterase [Streptomyces oryziradicis]|jgi:glycerophosphoryl diester phosphodiesterase|nr:glycerophosphoryl diester phosphodiesterase [Actinacidiphila oryziradicis]